jgi:hypothetical protein
MSCQTRHAPLAAVTASKALGDPLQRLSIEELVGAGRPAQPSLHPRGRTLPAPRRACSPAKCGGASRRSRTSRRFPRNERGRVSENAAPHLETSDLSCPRHDLRLLGAHPPLAKGCPGRRFDQLAQPAPRAILRAASRSRQFRATNTPRSLPRRSLTSFATSSLNAQLTFRFSGPLQIQSQDLVAISKIQQQVSSSGNDGGEVYEPAAGGFG